MTQPEPIVSHALGTADSAVAHGFFTRAGGVSDGLYGGLNVGLGSQDDPARVQENRRRVRAWLAREDGFLATLHQIHSPDVVLADGIWPDDARPKGDALVTNRPGIMLGVLTADCGPVLFADAEAGVIGAAHAGWKGATGGVLENTVAAMEALGARRERIVAVLGPTISQPNYEVGPDFIDRLAETTADAPRFLKRAERAGHALFDLPGYILARLEAAGVSASWTGHCTYGGEDRFFSYRRTTHRREPDYGRQISTILLKE